MLFVGRTTEQSQVQKCSVHDHVMQIAINSSFGNLNLPHRAVIPETTIHHNGHNSPLRIQSELDHDQLTRFDTLLIDRSRCTPALPPVPRPPWSPAEASTLPVLVSLLLTITLRAPTATCLSTLARRASLSATGASLPRVSSLPSALLVSVETLTFFFFCSWVGGTPCAYTIDSLPNLQVCSLSALFDRSMEK